MIIVKLMGGLGNQMFQYALGRSLSHARQTELKLDLGWFGNIPECTTKRVYELHALRCRESFAAEGEIGRLKASDVKKWLSRRSSLLGKKSHVCERRASYDPELFLRDGDLYLEGFWQSEKYFAGIRDILQDEFLPMAELDLTNREVADRIAASNAVSLHVRRGDYVFDPNASAVHGTCSLEYYRRSMEEIAARTDRPFFFVFSDDPKWAADNLKCNHGIEFISHNGPDSAAADLFLMSRCRHHVIANSTFSWWGAWLCTNPEKVVIAPATWFASGSIDTTDLLPDGWLRI